MHRRGLFRRGGFLIVLATLVLASGCARYTGDPSATPTWGPDGTLDYSNVRGTVVVDGSSTVFPIAEAVAEEYALSSDVRPNVAFSGTGGGIERFCRGDTDVANASRPMRQSEVEACAARGIDDIVEVQIAIDALTVMVNPQNDWASCLTVQQLHDIFRVGGHTNWNQVDPAFPNAPIIGYSPGTDSGTFDYFVEAIIKGVDQEAGHRGDFTSSEDDNLLAQGIEGDRNSIGYFGFAHYLEAGQSLKALAIDGGDGCVEPTYEAALHGTYQPLSRPLFLYTRDSLLDQDPAVLGYVTFLLEHMEALVQEVGYIALPPDLFEEQWAKVDPYLPAQAMARRP